MFKSLLQTIPTISGNFTLACKLNNYSQNSNYEYTSYINDAILMPLDNNYNLTKDIKINLINGKYEFDIMKYFKEISANFYNDTYLKNNNIFETYSSNNLLLPDNRDKNFEFGCKRISYYKYQYQYQFYAPIYINHIDDLPDEFIIEIYNNQTIVKKIYIPINKKSIKNKLYIYLKKFIEKIQNNIPIVWNFNDNKIIYNNAIDCVNGGFVTINSYNTIQSNDVYQTIINDIDNLICQNYSQNKIILSECIPLSFIFNIDDLLEENDLYYYNFNNFKILGYYVKNNYKCKYYTFSTNYHNNYQSYQKFDNINSNLVNQLYNIFDNDVIYSLKEGTNYKLYYQNTFKNRYCQWKLLESNSYIINLNSVFTYNSIENKFPVYKNSLQFYPKTLFYDSTLYLPINNHINIFNKFDKNQYNLLLNNNYSNWFQIYNYDDQYIQTHYEDLLKRVYNNFVFINGIRYKIEDNNIKYFNVFINPITIPYEEEMIVGDVILEKEIKNDLFIDYNYLEENNQLYNIIKEEDYNKYEDNDEIYIKFDQFLKYIDDSDDIITKIYSDKDNSHYIGDSMIGKCNKIKEMIKYLYDIEDSLTSDELDRIYLERYNKIYQYYFKHVVGYQKIDISLNDYTESELFTIFKNDSQYIDSIYYSLPNSKVKSNLYYELINKNVDYQYLLNNNITLFIQKRFVEIYNTTQFYNILFSDNGIFTKMVNDVNDKVDNENNIEYRNNIDYVLEFINVIKSLINDNNVDWVNYNSKVKNVLDKFNLISNNSYDYEFIQSIFINFCNSLLDVIIYITLFVDLNNYCNNINNKLNLYKYIPYYNDNNIIINYDYYESILNKDDYKYLFTNIQLNNDSLISDKLKRNVYTHITNIDMLNYYMNNYNDLEFYHKETEIDIPQETNKLILLKDYINNKLYDIIYNQIITNTTNNSDWLLYFKFLYSLENNNILIKTKYSKDYFYYKNDELSVAINKFQEYFQDGIQYTEVLNLLNKINNNVLDSTIYTWITKSKDYFLDIIIENSTLIDFDILEFIKKYTFIKDNKFVINLYKLIFYKDINNEEDNDYIIDNENLNTENIIIDLYIKINNVYLLSTNINEYIDYINDSENINTYNKPLIIYQESGINISNKDDIDLDNDVILVENIYNDFSKNKGQNFNYQQLIKNLNKIEYPLTKTTSIDLYTYKNPYNYLVKTNMKDYLINYKQQNILPYYKLDDLNDIKIKYISNGNYAYIVIDYYLMLSTNLFNIYQVDNNDNIEIKYINNINLVNSDNSIIPEKINGIFRYIYPYLRKDLLLEFTIQINNQNYIYDNNLELIKNPIKIILPNNIKCNVNTIVNKKPDNNVFSNITLSNNIIKILYLNRYFGNIDPYFIEVDQMINNTRSKIYIINDTVINNISDNDNVYIEDLNIYKYNSIPYYQQRNSQLQFIKQFEYKHFNDNYILDLPNEIQFIPDNIDYVYKNDLSNYINKEKCFEYFKRYLQNNFINGKLIKDEKLFLYIFNKYSIEYIQYKEQENVLKNSYKITYKLTLL